MSQRSVQRALGLTMLVLAFLAGVALIFLILGGSTPGITMSSILMVVFGLIGWQLLRRKS